LPDPAGDGLGCAGLDKDERVRVVSIYALKGRFQDLLRPAVRGLYRLGITANTVTVAAALGSLLVAAADHALGLQYAWLAKPLVEGGLACVSFVLMRYVVYR